MSDDSKPDRFAAKGPGANSRPVNRFVSVSLERELDYLEHDDEAVGELRNVQTRYYPDASQSINIVLPSLGGITRRWKNCSLI